MTKKEVKREIRRLRGDVDYVRAEVEGLHDFSAVHQGYLLECEYHLQKAFEGLVAMESALGSNVI